jgi:hypothetical protein
LDNRTLFDNRTGVKNQSMKILHSSAWTRHDDAAMMQQTVQVRGGIRSKLFVNGKKVIDTFSPRPYQLGQHCDGTIDDCVHALFINWCKAKDYSPEMLYREAYPNEEYPVEMQKEIQARAGLEGVAYPEEWGAKEFEGLIESLTEINNHSLVSVLEEKAHKKEIELSHKT